MKLHKIQYEACQENYATWIKHLGSQIRLSRWPFLCACLGEFFGTMIVITFGLGCLAQRTLGNYDAKGDFLCVSINWGIGAILGLFVSGVMGAGLMNPALTLAFAVVGKIPLIRLIPYTLSQFGGAWIGTLLLLAVYDQKIEEFVSNHDRGLRLMNDTGVLFATRPSTTHIYCVMDQIFGTAILAGMALTIGDPCNFNVPKSVKPLYINFLWAGLKNSMTFGCGGASNPARDLSPRIALLMTGWGADSFSDGDYYFWVPIAGPYIGALAGAVAYKLLIGIHLEGLEEDLKNQYSGDSNGSGSSQNIALTLLNDVDNEDDLLILVLPRHTRIVKLGRLKVMNSPKANGRICAVSKPKDSNPT